MILALTTAGTSKCFFCWKLKTYYCLPLSSSHYYQLGKINTLFEAAERCPKSFFFVISIFQLFFNLPAFLVPFNSHNELSSTLK